MCNIYSWTLFLRFICTNISCIHSLSQIQRFSCFSSDIKSNLNFIFVIFIIYTHIQIDMHVCSLLLLFDSLGILNKCSVFLLLFSVYINLMIILFYFSVFHLLHSVKNV